MNNSKKDYAPLLILFILLVAILVSSCTTCKSSQYRRKNFASLENQNINVNTY